MHYDETSKEGFKYGVDQSYVLGLFDMDGGAAITHCIMMKASNTGLSRRPRSKINHTCWDYLTWTVEQHNTLHYDETSKEGFKYGSIQVTTEQDQSYVLGLFDMDGGAA